jgi:transketolase
MRTAFIQELIVQARINPSIFLVVGDLGYSVVEPFAAEFPDRFINAGVAEQNMTGVAAGLASEGYHVFTYSIANFPTLRCLEQIRNDVCYHNLPVTIVSVGAGLAYGNLGYSHHAIQDFAAMRGMPNITVLSPADPGETRECVKWLSAHAGPSYLRIGKAGEPSLYESSRLGASHVLVAKGCGQKAIVCTGSILRVALEASSEADPAQRPSVYSFPIVHPIGEATIREFSKYEGLLVMEEHVRQGGLFAALCEVMPPRSALRHCFINPTLASEVGSQSYLWELAKFKAAAVAFIRALP